MKPKLKRKAKKPRRVVLGVGYLIFTVEGVALVNLSNNDLWLRGRSFENRRVRLIAEILPSAVTSSK